MKVKKKLRKFRGLNKENILPIGIFKLNHRPMFNPIYFSDCVNPAAKKITFAFVVIGRFFKIFFSRNKQLTLQKLDYSKKYQFDKSLLIIRYEFKNALWYNFHGIKKTNNAGVIVLNIQNLKAKPIILTVHGFFNKKTFQFDIQPEARLQASYFNTAFIKPYNLQHQLAPLAVSKFLFKPVLSKVSMCYTSILKPLNNFQIVHQPFNQTQFI